MAYNDDIGFVMDNRPIFRGGVKSEEITTAVTLNGRSEVFQILKNKGSGVLVVTLPSEEDGLYVWVHAHSGSDHNIEVKDVAASTVATLTVGEGALFVCDGSSWHKVIKG